MKIGAIVLSYHLTKYLKAVLKSLSDIDVVLVVNSRFAGAEESTDDTLEILRELNQPNVIFVVDENKKQNVLLQESLVILWDCKYVIINDADEFLLRKDRREMLEDMLLHRAEVGFCRCIDYASDTQRYEIRGYRPAMIVKPTTRFPIGRTVAYGNGLYFDKYVHHFGYALDKKNIEWKRSWYNAPPKEITRIMEQKKYDCKIPEEIMKLLEE